MVGCHGEGVHILGENVRQIDGGEHVALGELRAGTSSGTRNQRSAMSESWPATASRSVIGPGPLPVGSAPEYLGLSRHRHSSSLRSPAAESSLVSPVLAVWNGLGEPVPLPAPPTYRSPRSWFAWSPAVSGSLAFNDKGSGTVTGGPRRGTRAYSPTFQSATEPTIEDPLHLGVVGEERDLSITDPSEQVRGGDLVCITLVLVPAIPVRVAAVKAIPVAVVSMDIAATRFGAALAGVGTVHRFGRGTSPVRGSAPPRRSRRPTPRKRLST